MSPWNLYSEEMYFTSLVNRRNERYSALIIFSLLTISLSHPITFAYSNFDYNGFARERDAGRIDYHRNHGTNRDNEITMSSIPKERKVKDETKYNVHPYSNQFSSQHGLIAVSILVEDEERTLVPILSFDEHHSNTSRQNDRNIIWMVSVNEIQIGKSVTAKEKSRISPTTYIQPLFLEWKKIENVNERGIKYKDNVEINGRLNKTNRLCHDCIYYAGTANHTFMIPLDVEFDDPTSSAFSTLRRTYVISLLQSTCLSASTTSNSLDDEIRNKKHCNDRNRRVAVLTRRLVSLPYKTDSHRELIIEPVVEVSLHYIQRQRYEEKSNVPQSSNKMDRKSTNDNKKYYVKLSILVSRKGFREFLDAESNFLWTLLLLCAMHVVQTTPFGSFVIRYLCSESTKRSRYMIHDNRIREHSEKSLEEVLLHFKRKEGGDVDDNEVSHSHESRYQYQQQVHEIEKKQNQAESTPFQEPLLSTKNKSKTISIQDISCGGDPRLHDGWDIAVKCGRSDGSHENNHDTKEGLNEGSRDHYCLYDNTSPQIVHKEVLFEGVPMVRRCSNMGLLATKCSISTLSNEFENFKQEYNSSGKVYLPPNAGNCTKAAEAAIADKGWSSARETSVPSSSRNLKIPEVIDSQHDYDIPESLIQKKRFNAPFEKVSIVNCRNEKTKSGHLSSNRILQDDNKFLSISNIDDCINHESELGKSDRYSSCLNDSVLGGLIASSTHQTHSTREKMSKLVQSHSTNKENEVQKKNYIEPTPARWKTNTSQCSETEESYVSTLPPDSDYLSDDDPILLLSRSKSQECESRIDTDCSDNERKRKKISTSVQIRCRKKLSRCLGLYDETHLTKRLTFNANGQKISGKDLSKESDLNSVEVIHVAIPEKGVKRPYIKSNYVAGWVPSNELQSMSKEFFRDESWDIVAPTLRSTSSRVIKSISRHSEDKVL